MSNADRDSTVSRLDEAAGPAPTQDFDAYRRGLSELARKQESALLRYFTAVTRSAQEARELVQATYAKMMGLDPKRANNVLGFLAGYMWRVAQNLVHERQRSYVIRGRWDRELREEASWSPVAVAPSPESLLYTQQQLELVGEALSTLPNHYVEAFRLKFVEDLKIDEIARTMGIADRTVRKYLAQAAQRIHAHLDAAENTKRSGVR